MFGPKLPNTCDTKVWLRIISFFPFYENQVYCADILSNVELNKKKLNENKLRKNPLCFTFNILLINIFIETDINWKSCEGVS